MSSPAGHTVGRPRPGGRVPAVFVVLLWSWLHPAGRVSDRVGRPDQPLGANLLIKYACLDADYVVWLPLLFPTKLLLYAYVHFRM